MIHSATAVYPIDTHFDTQLANQIAQKETYNKHIYRPNTYLHKWWARRCGSTFRLLLKHLVDDPTLRDYYIAGGLDGKIILDPMMGGGTTLHEAIRLGANVIGADIDPIPLLQARATLSEIPLADLQADFDEFLASLQHKLGHLYETECPTCQTAVPEQYTLYALRHQCSCGHSLCVDSLILRQEMDGSVLHIDPLTHHILRDDVVVATRTAVSPPPIHNKKQRHCPTCHEPYRELLDLPYYGRYTPIAVYAKCPQHGRFFNTPNAIVETQNIASQPYPTRPQLPPLEFIIPPGPKSNSLKERKIFSYLDLFSHRQLLFLQQVITQLPNYPITIRLPLALLISTALEFNSMLCGYKGAGKRRSGAIRHTFTYHAYTFPNTAVENNPIFPNRSSGSLKNLFVSRIVRGRNWAKNPIERKFVDGKTLKVTIDGEQDWGREVEDFEALLNGRKQFLLLQGTSANLQLPNASIDHIVTDPPYFDSVQYSDLAAFFRVWLRQLLPDSDVRGHYSLDDSAVKLKSNGDGTGQYRRVLTGIFTECHRVLKENGRLIFTFHHWKPKGWADLTIALKEAGFHLINRYVVHAENLASVHIINQDVMLHDLILVLAKKPINIDWAFPDEIQLEKGSEDFVEGCGTAVGHFLNANMTPDDIETHWRTLLNFT